MEVKKLFCVAFTNQEDWDNPTILHIRTTDRDSALKIALNKIGFTDYLVIEVDDVIEDDGVTNEPDPEITGCPDCGSDDIENLGFNYDTAEIEHECKNCGYRGNRDNFLLIGDE
jgi:hypothetical protein